MKIKSRKKTSGFTLVELMAVTVILLLLAGTATIATVKMVAKARIRTTVTQISSLGSAISTFHLECGFFPTALQDLISEPSSGRKCKGYPEGGFLEKKEIPQDPWGNPYNFTQPGIHNTDGYDLWSNGPDGDEGTSDDVTNWQSEKTE